VPKKLPRGKPPQGTRFPFQVFAENVMVARTLRRFSQPQLAERMRRLGFPGWTQSTVSQVERGQRSVHIDELWSLALALNTTIEFLLDPSERTGSERALEDIFLAPDAPELDALLAPYFIANHKKKSGHPPWPDDGARVVFEDVDHSEPGIGPFGAERVVRFRKPEGELFDLKSENS
jgi:transcriptional regulator with XRE-family HTH domain